VNFYKHHLGDYAGATAHLSWDEDMAYTRLLRAYYLREGPIPDAEKHRLTRATSKAERAAIDTVLNEFFQLREDGWHNKRADAEVAAYQSQANTNRLIARTRPRTVDEPLNEPSTNRPPAYSASGAPNQKPEPRTRNQKPEENQKQGAVAPDWLPPEFAEFLQHRREKKSAMTPTAIRGAIAKLGRWRAEGKDIAAIIRHSIEQGYTGIFEPPPERVNGSRVTANNVSAAQEWVRREQEKDEHENRAS
jgi:uncharacterized protein YdaU (DUF1376 family)